MKKKIAALVEQFGAEKLCSTTHLCLVQMKLSRFEYEDFWKGVLKNNHEVEVQEAFDFANQLVNLLVEEELVNYHDLACYFYDNYESYNDYGYEADVPLSTFVYEGFTQLTEDWLDNLCGDEAEDIANLYIDYSRAWYWAMLYEYCIMVVDSENEFTKHTLHALKPY